MQPSSEQGDNLFPPACSIPVKLDHLDFSFLVGEIREVGPGSRKWKNLPDFPDALAAELTEETELLPQGPRRKRRGADVLVTSANVL